MAKDGQIQYLSYHQARLEKTFAALFSHCKPHEIADYLNPPKEGLYRVRIVYDDTKIEIEYLPYTLAYRNDFVLVDADFTYDFKYQNRECFEAYIKAYPNKELIFCKDGLITDTTIANIACYINGTWVTPSKPLLEGTTRARLIDEKRLQTDDITIDAFKNASRFALMNALTDFYEVKNATISDKTR